MFFHVITRTLCFILDFQKRPLPYLIWRLAAFWPKKLAPLAKKHLRSTCSKSSFIPTIMLHYHAMTSFQQATGSKSLCFRCKKLRFRFHSNILIDTANCNIGIIQKSKNQKAKPFRTYNLIELLAVAALSKFELSSIVNYVCSLFSQPIPWGLLQYYKVAEIEIFISHTYYFLVFT